MSTQTQRDMANIPGLSQPTQMKILPEVNDIMSINASIAQSKAAMVGGGDDGDDDDDDDLSLLNAKRKPSKSIAPMPMSKRLKKG